MSKNNTGTRPARTDLVGKPQQPAGDQQPAETQLIPSERVKE